MRDAAMDKWNKRKDLHAKLAGMSDSDRRRADVAIANHVVATSLYQMADTVLLYLNIEREVSADAIVEHALRLGKRVAVPAFVHAGSAFAACELRALQATVRGRFGVREPLCKLPCDPRVIDLAIVPGLGFTSSGVRLGRGGGHFDRFLRLLRPRVPIYGLAYECQICDNLPVEAHDVRVGAVVTESGIRWVERELARRAQAAERGEQA